MNTLNEEVKGALQETVKNSFLEVGKEFDEQIAKINVKLKDIEENCQRSEKDAGISKLSKNTREEFGKKIKGLFVSRKGSAPSGMKADEYIVVGTTGAGEELVNTEIAKGILRIAETHGVALSMANVVRTASQTMAFVSDTSSGDNGSFVGENTDAERDKIPLSRKEIIAKKWKKVISVSEEALQFSEPEDLANYILSKLGEHYGSFVDNVVFKNILKDTGISSVIMKTGKTAFTDLNYDYLVDMVSAVEDSIDDKCVFIGSKSVLGIIRKMKDSNNRPLIDSNIDGRLLEVKRSSGAKIPRAELLNYPFYTAQGMPKSTDSGVSKNFLFFGSLKDLVGVVINGSLTIESDKNIINGIIDYAGSAFVNGDVINAKGGVLLKTAAS